MKPNFETYELIPAVIQDFQTKEILMLGYMNIETFNKTLKEKKVWFYSRSKQRLWMKGESSGNFLNFISYQLDCDNDVILIQAKPEGPTCHLNTYSCFGDKNLELRIENLGLGNVGFLNELFLLIKDRKETMPINSYTTLLFKEGLNKICEKIEEESEELIRAAKTETKQRLTDESADLLYHLFVLLAEKDLHLDDVVDVLLRRNN